MRYDGPRPPVLLIDEVDRADDEFEALLLEFLGEGSVTVPELGTFTAKQPPVVVLTSNRSRDLHDALRRRCLYHWLEFPDAGAGGGDPAPHGARRRTAPLIESATQFVGHVRTLDVDKPPGIAEAINWVAALSVLGVTELVRDDVVATLGALAKTPDDRDLVVAAARRLRVRLTVAWPTGRCCGRSTGRRSSSRWASGCGAPGVPVTFTALRRVHRGARASRRPRDVPTLYWLARVTLVSHAARPRRVRRGLRRGVPRRRAAGRGQARRRRGRPAPTTCSAPVGRRPAAARARRAALPWHTLPRHGRDRRRTPPTAAALPELLPSAVERRRRHPVRGARRAAAGAARRAGWRAPGARWPTRPQPPAGGCTRRAAGWRCARRSPRRGAPGWEPVRAAAAPAPVRRPRPLTLVVDVSQSMQPLRRRRTCT